MAKTKKKSKLKSKKELLAERGSSPKKGKTKSSKASRRAAREAKRAARKGDGTFPDILVVTKVKTEDGKRSYFYGHKEDLSTLYDNDETVAVYKLRRVSKIVINRKVAR